MSGGDQKVRLGIVGADIIHALEYASVFRPEPGSDDAMIPVAPLRPKMESRKAKVRTLPDVPPPTPWNRAALERDPDVAAFEVVGWWGPSRDETAKMADRLQVPIADRLDDLVRDVDAALICTYEASEHYELAMPFLEGGRHVFVDKPFTDRFEQARSMVQTADRRGAVLFSSSPWKWAPNVDDITSRLEELGQPHSAIGTGPIVDGRYFYTTHSVELVQKVLGAGAERVSGRWTDRNYSIVIDYADGRTGFVNGLREVAWLRHLAVFGELGYLEAEITNSQRDEGKVQMMVEFARAVRSGKPPVPHSWLAEVVAVLCAAERSSHEDGQWQEIETH